MSGQHQLSAEGGVARENNTVNKAVEFKAETIPLLLKDAIRIFRRRSVNRIGTYDLIRDLSALPNRRWAGMSADLRGAQNLARVLRTSLIRPATIKFGSRTAKGYYRGSFERALERSPGSPLAKQGGRRQ